MPDSITPTTTAFAKWMFAEVVDVEGSVVVRTEGYVSIDGDVTALAQSAVNRFRRANPDTSLIDEIAKTGFSIRFGKQI